MTWEFTCPKCGYIITEQDFSKNEKILANLKSIFDKHKNDYTEELTKKIIINFQESQKSEIEKIIAKKENEFNKVKQDELNKLNEIINNQKIELSNNKTNLEKLLIEKENSINLIKQSEIDELKDHIGKLNILIETNKTELKNTLFEKENEFNKVKQDELNKLNEIINNQKIELSNNKTNLEKLLIEKENEFIKKQTEILTIHQKELNLLNIKIGDLEIANATNKVIQSKVKGENFEHDVYSELLKVFDDDVVTKITTGDKKADYLQEVVINNIKIGKIVYEVKNAEWSNTWEKKLVDDMSNQKAKYGILVATSFNKKYPGIPFKKSDENTNIYICDSDSFIFVGQIIRSLIKVEDKLNSEKEISNYDEKIKLFMSWKEINLPKWIKMFEDNFVQIKEAETSISKRVDKIRIARERMHNNALHNIKEFLDNFNF